MKTNNEKDPLDALLTEVFLEQAYIDNLSSANTYYQQILSIEPSVEMPQQKKVEMLERLQQALAPVTLGQLLQNEMSRINISIASAVGKTGLPEILLKDIQQDKLYPNNIPILLLHRLIELLNTPFALVKQGIKETYKLLQSQSSPMSFGGVNPAFKKGNYLSKEVISRTNHANDGKELFQNEEALNRYINRLEELINE
jgi:hypothetical protein